MIVFDKLWETMERQGISQYKLINTYGISTSQISRLRHNEGVSTHTLSHFCEILGCDISDIAEYREDAEESGEEKTATGA